MSDQGNSGSGFDARLAGDDDAGHDPAEADEKLVPVPLLAGVSGLYQRRALDPRSPTPAATPLRTKPASQPPVAAGTGAASLDDEALAAEEAWAELDVQNALLPPLLFRREELRLDVDGRYPQMTASGTLYHGLRIKVDWIAKLTKIGPNKWTGSIWYKHGDTGALPYTRVSIKAEPSPWPEHRKARVVFSGGGVSPRATLYSFKSRYYRPVQFEFDTVSGTSAVTSVNTHDHPNRPASLGAETLSVESVFRRAGFDVAPSTSGPLPVSGAGADARWSDAEMHDAMQIYWSKWASKPQWALWVLSASLHEMGTSLGGIMFDSIGPNHRQGTAVFNDAFIANAPAGDANPAAWVRRMRFWTVVHEMGHAFNLAHAWQKSLGTPWIPLADEPESRSFMNYPYRVAGGQAAFFANFAYRFSDPELLFMRHAPDSFVQMGNADWFDHHGLEQARAEDGGDLKLEVRVNRDKPVFQFMEPVMIELKLSNTSEEMLLVDENALLSDHDTVIILKKDGRPARQWRPFARYCLKPKPVALKPGEAIYAPLFVSTGLNGWELAEPGRYTIQVAIQRGEGSVTSRPLQLRITPPTSWEEERLAQDLFSDEVGRVLTFDGSRSNHGANDTLREVAARLPERAVACHAQVALASSELKGFRVLDAEQGRPAFRVAPPKPEAFGELNKALLERPQLAAETLGHIEYKYYVDRYSAELARQGQAAQAAASQEVLQGALQARGVKPEVVEEVEQRKNAYRTGQKPDEVGRPTAASA